MSGTKIKSNFVAYTYATIALSRGVPVADVARSLGHSTPTTTMRTYAHSLRARDGAAERALESLFAGL